MADEIKTSAEIPKARYYVTMVDRFFSGWGQAEGRKARYIAERQGSWGPELREDRRL